MLPVTGNAPYGQERLRSRSARALVDPFPVGLHELGSGAGLAEGYLYVPAGYQGETPTPLVLLLHGAGEDARDGLAQLRGQADEAGIVLLASSSRGPTWDSILARGRYGAAVAAIDRVLGHAFALPDHNGPKYAGDSAGRAQVCARALGCWFASAGVRCRHG